MTENIENQIEAKILGILQVYPKISPSMMQIQIGSSMSTFVWKPVFDQLIERGLVKRETVSATVAGKTRNFTVISLA